MAKKKATRKKATKKKVAPEEAPAPSSDDILFRHGMLLSHRPASEYFSTGSVQLDLHLGGYRRGSWVHLIGPNFIGKTTLCLTAIREFVTAVPDGFGVYFDSEGRLEPHHHTKVPGLNMDRVVHLRPHTAEEMLDLFEELIGDDRKFLFVFDSLDSFCTKSERERSFSSAANLEVARLASAMGRRMRLMTAEKKDTAIFVSQQRSKPSMGYGGGDTMTTFGGQALYFYADLRMVMKGTRVYKKNFIYPTSKEEGKPIGHYFDVQLDKTETLNAFATIHVPIVYGQGISRVREVLEIGLITGNVSVKGSWATLLDTKGAELMKQQGWDNLIKALEEDPEIMSKAHDAVVETYKQLFASAKGTEDGAVHPVPDE